MREELDALIGVGWGESSPGAKAIATGLHPRAFSLRLVGSRTCRFREIGRASFIPRSSSATVAMNPKWPKG